MPLTRWKKTFPHFGDRLESHESRLRTHLKGADAAQREKMDTLVASKGADLVKFDELFRGMPTAKQVHYAGLHMGRLKETQETLAKTKYPNELDKVLLEAEVEARIIHLQHLKDLALRKLGHEPK